MNPQQASLRILTTALTWQGANDYAFLRAFRTAGHSVANVSPEPFSGTGWESAFLKVAKRVLQPALVRAFNEKILKEAENLRPDLFFVFKGPLIESRTLRCLREAGTVCIQFYPDVSFRVHGPYLSEALKEYDWVFTTKSFGLKDLHEQLGVTNASFLPHGFDPETHRKWALSDRDLADYSCDVSFIGTWSPKKTEIIRNLARAVPDRKIRVWGNQWEKAGKIEGVEVVGRGVRGPEYSRAIRASSINLGLLSERRAGASDGDHITSRTFHIPASGGFLLHERTGEALQYFEENIEAAFFEGNEELAEKVNCFLDHTDLRERITEAGYEKLQRSGLSIRDRVQTVIEKYNEIAKK